VYKLFLILKLIDTYSIITIS